VGEVNDETPDRKGGDTIRACRIKVPNKYKEEINEKNHTSKN
jgi:hypothetical protein